MISLLRKVFAPPTFTDEKKSQVAGIVNAIILILAVGALLFFILSTLDILKISKSLVNNLSFIAIFISIGLKILLSRGYIHFSGILLSIIVFAIFSVPIFLWDGIRDIAITGYYLSITIASLVLLRCYLFVFAIGISLAVITAYWLEFYDILVTSYHFKAHPIDLLAILITLNGTALIAGFTVNKMLLSDKKLREERDKAQNYLDIAGVIIIALNMDHKIILVNRKGCDVLGFPENEIIGKIWHEAFIPPALSEEIKIFFNKLITGESHSPEYYENPVQTKNGLRIIAWYNTMLRDSEGTIIGSLSSGEDITERKLNEKKIHNLLEEKEILLREVHHRIKNNMFTMQTILSLQEDSTEEPAIQKILSNVKNRMTGMMVLYEKLYKSDYKDDISMDKYLPALVDEIIKTYPLSVTTLKNIPEIKVPVSIASTLGIIINELISNAMKHAFNDGKENIIEIYGEKTDSFISIIVKDNGKGFNTDFRPEGFGFKLVNDLIEHIDGSFTIEQSDGTKCTLKFPVPSYK